MLVYHRATWQLTIMTCGSGHSFFQFSTLI